MMIFSHPEYLYYLLAIPFFFLFYGLFRLIRKKICIRKGLPVPVDENPKFTISNGWFVLTITSLVFAILVLGISHPRQTDEDIIELESKKLELMLDFDAFDISEDAISSQARLAIAGDLKALDVDSLKVRVGTLVGTDLRLIQALSNNYLETARFLEETPLTHRAGIHTIADAIHQCMYNVRWGKDDAKHAIILFSDGKEFSNEKSASAMKAAQEAAKKGIFTYVVGLGADTDTINMQKLADAGKGVFLQYDNGDADLDDILNAVKKNKKTTFIDVMNYILLFIVFLVTPSLVIYLCKKYKWIGKMGPIIWLYGIGMLLGNLTINGASLFPDQMKAMQDILSTAMVPLAIPLMLYSCTLNKKEIDKHFKAMILGVIAVVTAVVGGYFIVREHIPEANKVAGMLTGVYTGGTINLAAIKESLQASKESYILIQTYDIIICLSYLIFLMVCGIKLFRKFLPFDSSTIAKKKRRKNKLSKEDELERKRLEEELAVEEIGFRSIFTKEGFKNTLVLFGITLLGIAGCAGITMLLFGGELNMTIFFLLITTFGIIGSFFKNIHDRKQHYNLGLYCIYIFSLARRR